MTKEKVAPKFEEVKALFTENSDALRNLLQKMVQDILEGEMENFLEAGPYERTETRRGYRAGYYS
ncbi:MAG: transposase, partial [Lentisphaeria bacterium]|nr:transposase [Lentisphaeria bacterium]